jgi:glycosyltransferase involved in cell wall biosynthesis
MIYVCIAARNDARTVGLLLWKIRQVFGPTAREYQLLVADEGSTDETADVLQRYQRALPLAVVEAGGDAGAADAHGALLREAVHRSDRHRRDAAVIIPADFSVSPEGIPELLRRLESGADLAVGERAADAWPLRWRLLARLTPWLLRPGIQVPGVTDFLSGCVAVRLIAVRSALHERAGHPFLAGDGSAARAELVARLAAASRQIAVVTVPTMSGAAIPREGALALAGRLHRLGRRVRVAPPAPRTQEPASAPTPPACSRVS